MLIDIFPRARARFLKHPLLGDHLDGLARQLTAQGLLPPRIRIRICKAPVLEAMPASFGICELGELSRERLLALAPRPAQNQRASCQRSYGPWPGFWLTVALCGG